MNSNLIFDVPKLPFKELPRIPQCFCQYPVIFAMTYDLAKQAWFWRFDVMVEVKGTWVNFNVPAPVNKATGLPEALTMEMFPDILYLLAKTIKDHMKGN